MVFFDKKKKYALVMLMAGAGIVMLGSLDRERKAGAEAAAIDTDKKIAITFDDDVIIGLSQEISYKEAVSMI